MPIEFDIDLDGVEKIEFVFKKEKDQKANAIKTAVYPDNAIRRTGENIVLVPWTQAETYLFQAGSHIFMDTRITMRDTDDQPETNIVQLEMSTTLFEEA